MKTMKSLLAAGMVLTLVGCATSFKPWKLSDVHEGMSRNEVIAVLGEPDFTDKRDGAEYLYYTYQEQARGYGYADPMNEDMERKAEELTRILSETKYEVVLIEDQMINYKEVVN